MKYLDQALALAQTRLGFCAPNPAVGAVIVKAGEVIATGVHHAPGSAHAEIEALNVAGEAARGAVMYVTLEPCCHWGKTGPCVTRIIEAGITSVHYAFQDPNPAVHGRGAAALKAAGIQCDHVTHEAINAFYAPYAFWHAHQRPWVTAKIAMSLNGKIAHPRGSDERLLLTGSELNTFTHQNRRTSDGILTTINTILADDPQLNVRLENTIVPKPIFVLDTHARLPLTAQVCDTSARLVLLHGPKVAPKRIKELEAQNIQCIVCPEGATGLELDTCFSHIGAAGVHHIWMETGQQCLQNVLDQKLLQQLFVYLSPKWLDKDYLSAFVHPVDFSDAQHIQWHPMGREVYGDFRWE